MQSYATYTWPWQDPSSCWSPPWIRHSAVYQQPPPQHQTSYDYYNNAYYAYEQPQLQPAPPQSSWQPSYSEERNGAYYLSASEPEDVMEDDNATYDYVDLQGFLRLMAEQDRERSGAYYLSASASEPEEIMENDNATYAEVSALQSEFAEGDVIVEAKKADSAGAFPPPSTVAFSHIEELRILAEKMPSAAIQNLQESASPYPPIRVDKLKNMEDKFIIGTPLIPSLLVETPPIHILFANKENDDMRIWEVAVFSALLVQGIGAKTNCVADHHGLVRQYTAHVLSSSTVRCLFDPGGSLSSRLSLSTLCGASWFPP